MTRDEFFTPGGGPVKPWAAQERSGAKTATSPENLQRNSGSGIRRNGETGILPPRIW
jgi:hypothetical protein